MPSSLIDEHGCLHKWNKSGLVKHIGVLENLPVLADIVIVGSFPPYCVATWWQSFRSSIHPSIIQGRLSHYPDGTEKVKVVVFDKCKYISAKDH